MATTNKKYFREFWQSKGGSHKRDPETDQLRRDRITALVIVAIMALVFAVIAALSASNGGVGGPEVFDPWIMP